MSILNDSIALFEAERQVFLGRPKNVNSVGDIESAVKAKWLRLSSSGLGEVEYNQKVYKTIPLGTKSIPRGTTVQMTFAKGVYFSDW